MARQSAKFQCQQCATVLNKWAGQCPECQGWNSIQEIQPVSSGTASRANWAEHKTTSEVVTLQQLPDTDTLRFSSQIDELDRVLGGGLVHGSVVLLGGDPGIGKSTILLQCLTRVSQQQPALYVTGEESLQQISLRAQRLGLDAGRLNCLTETCVEHILGAVEARKPSLVVIDSIQTLFSEQVQSAPGSVSQVRESAAALVRHAKQAQCTMLLVGHVTKEGALAGPRVLEHMVDTVLYFEGESSSRYRVIRAIKNRFGAVNELGVFAMTDKGLREVSNPSAIFLERSEAESAGSAVMVVWEGTRPLLVEIQALVVPTTAAQPRRSVKGLAASRVHQVLASIDRHARISMGRREVYVSAMGGISIGEPAADLPIALAVASAVSEIPLGSVAAWGEVALTGEVRSVSQAGRRRSESRRLGIDRIVEAGDGRSLHDIFREAGVMRAEPDHRSGLRAVPITGGRER